MRADEALTHALTHHVEDAFVHEDPVGIVEALQAEGAGAALGHVVRDVVRRKLYSQQRRMRMQCLSSPVRTSL